MAMSNFIKRGSTRRSDDTMDEDTDDKDDTKRKSRNLSEKKRRDQFNMLINELSSMVSTNSRKMDKSTVLKSTISFLKSHNEIAVRSRAHEIQEDWKPSFLSNEEFTHLILEALDGFIMVFSSSGRIFYASESITSLLGHLPSDLLNMTIYDMVFEDDQSTLYNVFLNPTSCVEAMNCSDSKDNQVSFSCHLKRGGLDFREEVTYELVQFVGYFRSDVDPLEVDNLISSSRYSNYSGEADTRLVFVGTGRLQTPLLIREMSVVDSTKSEFTSRHSLEWKFLFLDHRAPPIIGYLPFEVLGTSGYDYYHVDDLEKVVTCHEALMQKGEGTSCHYRFLTKGQQWIWLQTRFYITYHQWNSKPEFIVCTHRVVSYVDVMKQLRKGTGNDQPQEGGASIEDTHSKQESEQQVASQPPEESQPSENEQELQQSDEKSQDSQQENIQPQQQPAKQSSQEPTQEPIQEPTQECSSEQTEEPTQEQTQNPTQEQTQPPTQTPQTQPQPPQQPQSSQPQVPQQQQEQQHQQQQKQPQKHQKQPQKQQKQPQPTRQQSQEQPQQLQQSVQSQDQKQTHPQNSLPPPQPSQQPSQSSQPTLQQASQSGLAASPWSSKSSDVRSPAPSASAVKGSRSHHAPHGPGSDSASMSADSPGSRQSQVTNHSMRSRSSVQVLGKPLLTVVPSQQVTPSSATFLEPQQQYVAAIPVQPVLAAGFPGTAAVVTSLPTPELIRQPIVMTTAQSQIQEQLQRKHEELQQLIVQQQEELRRVSEQLLMARYGLLPPVQLNVTLPYSTGTVSSTTNPLGHEAVASSNLPVSLSSDLFSNHSHLGRQHSQAASIMIEPHQVNRQHHPAEEVIPFQLSQQQAQLLFSSNSTPHHQ